MDYTELEERISDLPLKEKLQYIEKVFPGKAVFTTSFGVEDQVITDMLCRYTPKIRIATLDTGRLFEETYKVMNSTIERYGCHIEIYHPHNRAVEELVSTKGPFSFYLSVENRKECCHIRKVEPLGRALAEVNCWITGIRAEQSENRIGMRMIEEDSSRGLIKMNPLFDWNLQQVMDYLETHNIPYNSLHHKGFVSIGCAPCTRSIKPGEDFRAGRWWWENNTGKECGLHVKED